MRQPFTIRVESNSAENCYVRSATLNGELLNRAYLWHQEMVAGGELLLERGAEPNEDWVCERVPPSMVRWRV